MTFGGLAPFPRACGGQSGARLKAILESLNAQMGTAYNIEQSSTVYIRNLAIARLLNSAWSTNQRLANQSDPKRMTDCLPRWERIYNLPVGSEDSPAARRRRVEEHMLRVGLRPLYSRIVTLMTEKLGAMFVALEWIDISLANVHVPNGSYPWGTVTAGAPWYSTVAHILIRLQKLTWQTDGDYFEASGLVQTLLDPLLPSWVTCTAYRAPEIGTPIEVVGGPSAAGFYLDEPNVDILVFDV